MGNNKKALSILIIISMIITNMLYALPQNLFAAPTIVDIGVEPNVSDVQLTYDIASKTIDVTGSGTIDI